MMSNSNKFNVPFDIQMNIASNNTLVDWCTTLNYSSMQIQWSLGNPDPQVVRIILGKLVPVKLFQYTIIIIIIIIIIVISSSSSGGAGHHGPVA
jgi:hypothetical protein